MSLVVSAAKAYAGSNFLSTASQRSPATDPALASCRPAATRRSGKPGIPNVYYKGGRRKRICRWQGRWDPTPSPQAGAPGPVNGLNFESVQGVQLDASVHRTPFSHIVVGDRVIGPQAPRDETVASYAFPRQVELHGFGPRPR